MSRKKNRGQVGPGQVDGSRPRPAAPCRAPDAPRVVARPPVIAPPPDRHDDGPQSLDERLTDARARLLFMHPFLGYLVTHLEDERGARDVMDSRCDAETIYWADDFLGSLTKDDLLFVFAHHALHCALWHPWPR